MALPCGVPGLLIVHRQPAAAPLYARYVSGTDPFVSNVDGDDHARRPPVQVMQPDQGGLGLGVTPIGPTWRGPYFLGADSQGRDVDGAAALRRPQLAADRRRLAPLICLVLAALVGIVAGFFGGVVDAVLSRLLDMLWAFPVYLLAISLSIVLISQRPAHRPDHDQAGQPAAADLHHRHRLRALCRAAGARAGAVAHAERVRAGRDRPRACRTGASWCATSCPTSRPR